MQSQRGEAASHKPVSQHSEPQQPQPSCDSLLCVGSQARGSQPRTQSHQQGLDAQLGRGNQGNPSSSTEPCPSQAKAPAKAPAQDAEGKLLSPADKLARAPQPKRTNTSGSKSKQTNQPSDRASRKNPPGTQSVLRFFKAKP